jgi:cytochrome c oxidase cbb3-type subunit III
MQRVLLFIVGLVALAFNNPCQADLSLTLNKDEMAKAESMYQRYCSLCHGAQREGYKADHAPSLRSKSMLSTAYPQMLFDSIAFGRINSAMDGYIEEVGGPLTESDIILLIRWLAQKENISPIDLDQAPIVGNASNGKNLYVKNCASCHGNEGQGITGAALADQLFLSSATDSYLKYAIVNGRGGTPMQSFGETLKDEDINDIVAYVRSQASGWSPKTTELAKWPEPSEYVINPNGEAPQFSLREGRYVPAHEVEKSLKENKKFIILDTRPGSAWQRIHIPGAVPMPYYRDKSRIAENLPNDGTWIIAYCACPHAASDSVINHLRSLGYKNTGVIDEGIIKWIEMGLPVVAGKDKVNSVID